jgi:KDO transferase-3
MAHPAGAGCLEEYLGLRALAAAERRQQLRHAFRQQAAILQKWLRKTAWRSAFRHMHYVPPALVIEPAHDGTWGLRPRGGGSQGFVSRPLVELRNLTKRPAIVIATGASANEFDWSSLADGQRVRWAVNGAPTMLAARGLDCDFLVITDHRFAREGADHIELAVKQGATLVFSYEAAAVFAGVRPEILCRVPFHIFEKANAWYALPMVNAAGLAAMNAASGQPFVLPERPKPNVGWSHDPLLGVFAGKTVTFAALQLVVWSGAHDIEVIGLDLGGKTRAYQESRPAVSHLEAEKRDFILPSFQCLAKALAGGDVRITNLSNISPLPRDLIPVAAPMP